MDVYLIRSFIVLVLGSVLVGCATSRPTPVNASTMSTRDEAIPPPTTAAMCRPETVPPRAGSHSQRNIGTSVQGTSIVAEVFENPHGADPSTVLFFAAIHGDEPTTAGVAKRLIALLESHSAIRATLPRTVYLIPVANPDGLAKKTRTNAHGVDLNRNFDAKNWKSTRRGRTWNGTEPLSEPESRALRDLILQIRPARILALHSIEPGKHGNNYDGPARELAELLASHNRYPVLPTIGYPTPGSFGSWAGIDMNIPVITLELQNNMSTEKAWNENREALLTFLRGK
ncbi:MAG: DUF2817 domain-containing protein [Tepidisphaeraceae bacterium]